MKINKQVTDVERILTDSDSIASNADLKDVITYVNDTFIRISGYSREELIGVPHNVARHPDMSPEAFADLWRLMKAGRPCPVSLRIAARTVIIILGVGQCSAYL